MDISALGLYLAGVMIIFFTYCILTWGLNIQFGYTGIPNFSYITFMAAGAYFTGVVGLGPAKASEHTYYILGLGLPFPITLIAGAAAAGVLAAGLGVVGLRRLRNDYLAIVTFSVGFIAYDLAAGFTPLFNGFLGIYGVRPPFADVLPLDANTYTYFLLLLSGVIMLILWWVMHRLHESALGRTLRAIRDDMDVAEALGKNTYRFRLLALVVGCIYAGVGGALTVWFLTAFNPSAFSPPETFIIFAALLIGGTGNNLGAVVGSFLVPVLFIEGTRFLPPAANPEFIPALRVMIIGALLIAVMWFRPQGILPERPRIFSIDMPQLRLGRTTKGADG